MWGPFGSYAYNHLGIGRGESSYRGEAGLGLGIEALTGPTTSAARVKVPSEMFAIGESRFLDAKVNRGGGGVGHDLWLLAVGTIRL